jgi:hypothetical protein
LYCGLSFNKYIMSYICGTVSFIHEINEDTVVKIFFHFTFRASIIEPVNCRKLVPRHQNLRWKSEKIGERKE